MMQQNKSAGFTLVEMLLSVVSIALISGISVPVYNSFQTKNDMDVAVNVIAQKFHRAQILSRNGEGDSSWGVYLDNNGVILFQGTNFLTRDNTKDESFEFLTEITPSGLTEVVFEKRSGNPEIFGTVTLTNMVNRVRTLSINKKGMIEY
ncbi:hypothetical protein KAI58_03770 [Candidatus Gracilibacteria bacterium]|nr:hypothetical protein [Candidatus Gracilibacteria bacterium]